MIGSFGYIEVRAGQAEAVAYWRTGEAEPDEMGPRYWVTRSVFTASGVYGMTWSHMRRPFAEFVGCVQLGYLERRLRGAGASAFVRTFWRRFAAAVHAAGMEVANAS